MKKITDLEIIQHVAKHHDSFPLPDGVNPLDDIEVVIPASKIVFAPSWFCSMSKSGFARYQGVAPAQVSRWIKTAWGDGLPVRGDGRINVRSGDFWLEGYQSHCARRKENGWQ
jgi:hypothetical protein